MTTASSSTHSRSLAKSLWIWLVAYPVTRVLWFLAAIIAGACVVGAVLVFGGVISAIVSGLALIVALVLVAAVVCIAIAPVIFTNGGLKSFADRAEKAVKAATSDDTETPANREA